MSRFQLNERDTINTNSVVSKESQQFNQNQQKRFQTGGNQNKASDVADSNSSSRKGSVAKLTKNDLFTNAYSDGQNYQQLSHKLIVDTRQAKDDGEQNVQPAEFCMSPNGNFRKPFFSRTFSKLEKGSLRGSIFSLCAAAIGSGVLSLPYVLRLCGYVNGIIFMVVGALAAETTLRMLASTACNNGLNNYSKMVQEAGGNTLQLILSIMIILFMFGSCISYQIICTSLFQYVCIQFGMDPNTVNTTQFGIYQSAPTALFFLLPMSLQRDMSAFRYVSLCSIAALLYTGVVLIIEFPSFNSHFKDITYSKPFYFDFDMFTGCSMTFFAFQCQVQLMPIYSELIQPNYRRITKVVDRAIFIDFFFYLTIAVFGYFSSYSATETIVLKRDNFNGKKDYPILIAIISVMGCILVAFPCAWNPARQQIIKMVTGRDEFSQKENYIYTIVYIGVTWVISILFPKIDKIISIMGGLCAATLSFAIPTFCYVKLSGKPVTQYKNLSAIIIFGSLSMIGYISVGVTIFLIITGQDSVKKYLNVAY